MQIFEKRASPNVLYWKMCFLVNVSFTSPPNSVLFTAVNNKKRLVSAWSTTWPSEIEDPPAVTQMSRKSEVRRSGSRWSVRGHILCSWSVLHGSPSRTSPRTVSREEGLQQGTVKLFVNSLSVVRLSCGILQTSVGFKLVWFGRKTDLEWVILAFVDDAKTRVCLPPDVHLRPVHW